MTPRSIDHFAPLAADYDVLLCDVWGVVHDGLAAFEDACDALMRFRRGGGAVVLVTNAPRPSEVVVKLLDRMQVPRAAYDGIISSGDVTRAVVAERAGQRILHIGPERDLPLFTDLDLVFADKDRAEYCVCTGLFDDTRETPEDYRPLLLELRQRRMLMVCANPDVVVTRGDQLVYCAGAIADLYAELGGEVFYAGKPHGPIYRQAVAKAEAALGRAVPPARVLAIGDSVRTDLTGAHGYGVDFLFVIAGIHAEEFTGPDHGAALFAQAGAMPRAVMRALRW